MITEVFLENIFFVFQSVLTVSRTYVLMVIQLKHLSLCIYDIIFIFNISYSSYPSSFQRTKLLSTYTGSRFIDSYGGVMYQRSHKAE